MNMFPENHEAELEWHRTERGVEPKDEVWSICKCGHEKEGVAEVCDVCPECLRTGMFETEQ